MQIVHTCHILQHLIVLGAEFQFHGACGDAALPAPGPGVDNLNVGTMATDHHLMVGKIMKLSQVRIVVFQYSNCFVCVHFYVMVMSVHNFVEFIYVNLHLGIFLIKKGRGNTLLNGPRQITANNIISFFAHSSKGLLIPALAHRVYVFFHCLHLID